MPETRFPGVRNEIIQLLRHQKKHQASVLPELIARRHFSSKAQRARLLSFVAGYIPFWKCKFTTTVVRQVLCLPKASNDATMN